MIKGGYGADNAALLVDHFEGFLNETLKAKQSFLATIWFQVPSTFQPCTFSFRSLEAFAVPAATHSELG